MSEPPELGLEIEGPDALGPRIISMSVLIFKPEALTGVGVAAWTKDLKPCCVVSKGGNIVEEEAGREAGGEGAIVFEVKTSSAFELTFGSVVAEGGM